MNEHSSELGELAKSLAMAQGEFGAIPKTANNPFFKSTYADLATVVKTASPILSKHGLSVSQFLGTDDRGDTMTTWLLHESGQFITESMRLHLVKDDPQGQGSATSYARRYSYMSVMGLVADKDDDGNAGSKPKQPYKQQPKTYTKPQPGAESNPVAAAAKADPETGEKLHNLTRLMLDEITEGSERPKFVAKLEELHHVQIAKVPESLVPQVEMLIKEFSAGRPFDGTDV